MRSRDGILVSANIERSPGCPRERVRRGQCSNDQQGLKESYKIHKKFHEDNFLPRCRSFWRDDAAPSLAQIQYLSIMNRAGLSHPATRRTIEV
jgi:hypothetical protein